MEQFDLHEFDIYYDDFLSTPIQKITTRDVRNSMFIFDKIPSTPPKVVVSNLRGADGELFTSAKYGLSIYRDDLINCRVEDLINNGNFYMDNTLPFGFRSKFDINPDTGIVKSGIIVPRIVDDSSYVFLGHEIHHALKDSNPDERKLRDRFAEVIPMFYELVSADFESSEKIKNKIIDARMILLYLDRDKCNSNAPRCMQYYNSLYYALCLYSKYKENPKHVLMLVSKVLTHVIDTERLLKILNIYDSADLDEIVDYEYQKVFSKYCK